VADHDDVRICGSCHDEKPLSEFHVGNSGRRGSGRWCKPCRHTEYIAFRSANYASVRDKELRKLYGIGLSDYERMLSEQGGRCAICQTDKPGGGRSNNFHVDHDHETGRVRGLLCHGCNTGIGNLGDSSATLYRAMKYLEGYGK
jgi:hypothetical protein